MEILMSKEPSYIRCMKPNDAKQAGMTLVTPFLHRHQVPVRETQEGARIKNCEVLFGVGARAACGEVMAQELQWEHCSWVE